MNRRDFLKGLSIALFTAQIEIASFNNPVSFLFRNYELSYDEIVHNAIQKNRKKLADNVSANNALFSRIKATA